MLQGRFDSACGLLNRTAASLPARALLLGALLLLAGCAEMPEVIGETRPATPSITAGPYILLGPDLAKLDAYFRTLQPEVAGIRITGEKKLTRRYGSSTKDHVINILPLLPQEGKKQMEVLLGDVKAAQITVNVAPQGGAAALGFLGGVGVPDAPVATVATKMALEQLNAAVILGGRLPLNSEPAVWDRTIFGPLKPLTENSPVMLLPQMSRMLPDTYGGAGMADTYWSRDIGCVHLMFLDLEELKEPATRQKALVWLQQDLAKNSKPWAVLNLAAPLFGATRIHARAIETLGTLLETGGVDLVISGGADYYQRSLPVKSGDSGAVRYIVSGGLQGSGKEFAGGREYKAASSGEPHYAILKATPMQLEWSIYSTDGLRQLDTLTVFTDGHSLQGEPAVEKMDILTDALAALTLQREVLTISREAARAVANPQKPGQVSFVIANPSPRDIGGELIWNMAADSAYKVDPAAVRFDLKSGFEGVVNFNIERYAKDPAAPMPVFTVNMKGVGSASQQLVLSGKKQAEVFQATGQIVIDGIMAEDVWNSARQLEGFSVIGTGAAPKSPVEARVAYDPKGLYVVVRCAANDPETMATAAKAHDDPVYKDESVEVFIDPDNRARDYYQFAVNVKGVTLDRSSRLGLSWNPQWQSKVSTRKDFYTVEMLIPYQALGLPAGPRPGQRWAFNISRNDYQQSATRVNPFTAGSDKAASADKSAGVTRFNLAELAREDLGAAALKKEQEPKPGDGSDKKGSGLEISQWADTFGANDRSGMYGDLVFTDRQPDLPAPTKPAEKK